MSDHGLRTESPTGAPRWTARRLDVRWRRAGLRVELPANRVPIRQPKPCQLREEPTRAPDLSDLDYLQLPYVLAHGLWLEDSFSELCAVASCPSDNGLVRYKAVVKRPEASPELWLTTFHRLNPRQTKSLIERGGSILRAYRP